MPDLNCLCSVYSMRSGWNYSSTLLNSTLQHPNLLQHNEGYSWSKSPHLKSLTSWFKSNWMTQRSKSISLNHDIPKTEKEDLQIYTQIWSWTNIEMLIGEGIICHGLTEIKQVTTQYGLDIKSFRLGVCHKIAFCRLLLRGVAVKAGHCHCHGNVIDCVCVLFSSYILES